MFYVWIEVKLLTIKLDIQRKRALVCFYVKTIRFIGKNANNWKKCLLSSKIPIISTVFKFLTVLVKLLSCFIIHHVIFQVFLWWADVWVGMLTFLKSMLNYKLHEKCWRNKADLSANTKTFFFFFYIYIRPFSLFLSVLILPTAVGTRVKMRFGGGNVMGRGSSFLRKLSTLEAISVPIDIKIRFCIVQNSFSHSLSFTIN